VSKVGYFVNTVTWNVVNGHDAPAADKIVLFSEPRPGCYRFRACFDLVEWQTPGVTTGNGHSSSPQLINLTSIDFSWA
jgi:hypothetical protein